MAMSTWLQAVAEDELAALRHDPDSIGALDKPLYFRTHFATSINYFLTGAAYPTQNNGPLWPMLDGAESIATQRLEGGYFHIVGADRVPELANLLAAVDLAAVVAAASAEDLDVETLVEEEELYDLELFESDELDELPGVLTDEITGLAAFYRRAASAGLAVVTYTT